uniref:Uncharacterized protein MANES_02G080100 n=1 Tax=Rhizophora mucronata TaxID=61149 RepID=A0A2P2JFX2_RHIMU
MEVEEAAAPPSLIKQLAASDGKTRNRALREVLNSWLPIQSEIPGDDLKKLWKGFFYCVWHADKLPAQIHLIDRLSSVILDLPMPLSVQYFSVFLLTMRREWPGIDRLRLDKFYLLIRRFMRCFFLLLKKNSWDVELSIRMMGVLDERVFLADDNFQGNGVNYHIVSVFLEELRAFLPLSKPVVEVLLCPFVSLMAKVPDKILLAKIKTSIFDPLLKTGKKLLEVKKSGEDGDLDAGDDVVVLGSIPLALGFSTRFYELGSTECFQGNRKVLFGLHDEFLRLEKDLASSGFDISISEVDNDCDEDVPNLIPIAIGMEIDGSGNGVINDCGAKRLKKSKKAKKASIDHAKKPKKKKNTISDIPIREELLNKNLFVAENGNSNEEKSNDVTLIPFNESVISNLQKQFEKVAEEVGLDENVSGSSVDLPIVAGNGNASKKRKRAKSAVKKQPENPEFIDQWGAEDETNTTGGEKSVKKVRFSMKNNLVWKPHSPLPPQSLRLPPSVTPRGSALKKGIPAGPIREISANKKAKQRAKSLKKRQKRLLSIIPSIKHVKKLC